MKIKILLSVIFAALLLACPAGTHTTVQAGVGVKVDPSQCAEKADGGAQSEESVLLDCSSLTGEGKVTIEFPRQAWLLTKPAPDAGDLAAVRVLPLFSIDGNACAEDARDDKNSAAALLDCKAGGSLITISFGRQEWKAIKSRKTPGPVDAGPGK